MRTREIGKDRDLFCSCSASGLWDRPVYINNNEDSVEQKNGKRRKVMEGETNDTKAS